jgi:hypothetical protein
VAENKEILQKLLKRTVFLVEIVIMIGISNVGSDPVLSSMWPQTIHPAGRIADRIGRLEGNTDTVTSGAIIGDSEETSGVYSERDILWANRDKEPGEAGYVNEMDESERQMVSDLEARDREVRSHEQTHAALLGRYAIGGPSYTYQMGPDGRAYAVGGSIMADIGPEATPEATAMKARIFGRAAMGGGESSTADRSVALAANQMGIHAIA